MSDTQDADRSLRQYLLGALAEEERARIEAEALRHDGRFEELLALEDDLFHDYARGSLSDVERGQFEARFLSTPEGRERLDAARALLGRLAASPRALRLTPRYARWLAAAAALLVAAGSAFLGWRASQERVREAGRPSAPPSAVPSPPDPAPSPAPVRVIALALSPGLLRGGGATPSVTVPASGEATLRLTLRVPPRGRHERYAAALENAEGLTVWSGAVAPSAAAERSAVTLDVPARLVPEGDYEVVLRGLTATGSVEVAAYPLRVLRE